MTTPTTGMDLWAWRLACAYGLRTTAKPHVWPETPLYAEDARRHEAKCVPLTTGQLACVEGMWREGLSVKRIAEVMGVGHRRVENAVRRDRVRFPYRRPRRGKV